MNILFSFFRLIIRLLISLLKKIMKYSCKLITEQIRN